MNDPGNGQVKCMQGPGCHTVGCSSIWGRTTQLLGTGARKISIPTGPVWPTGCEPNNFGKSNPDSFPIRNLRLRCCVLPKVTSLFSDNLGAQIPFP